MHSLTNRKKSRSMFRRLVDLIIPNNCRNQLYQAARENQDTHNLMICILQDYGQQAKKHRRRA